MPLPALFLPGIFAAHLAILSPASPCRKPADAVVVDVVTVTVSGRRSPVVVLKETDSGRALPIVIGPYEADAIWARLASRKFPRPMTHDLLRSVLAASGVKVKHAVIYGEEEGIYYAFLTLKRRSRCFKVDSRPSDAIALALRASAPILVARRLMDSESAFDMDNNPAPVRLQGVTLQRLTPELAARLGVKNTEGALVADVRRGRFVNFLKRGDVIVEIDGRPVAGVVEAMRRLQALHPSVSTRFRVVRERESMELEVPAESAGKD